MELILLRTVTKKFGYSFSGIKSAWSSEPSFRQWCLLVLVSNVSAFCFINNKKEIVLILVLGWLLLASELINTAVESVVDLVTTDHHPLAKKSKDAASAMTLLTFISLLTAWVACIRI
jgi:diacylglycerol kinase (ATP)